MFSSIFCVTWLININFSKNGILNLRLVACPNPMVIAAIAALKSSSLFNVKIFSYVLRTIFKCKNIQCKKNAN